MSYKTVQRYFYKFYFKFIEKKIRQIMQFQSMTWYTFVHILL